MSQVRNQFGRELPLQLLFSHPTIAALADLLGRTTDSVARRTLVPIQPRGTRPALYCCPGAGMNTLYMYALARALGDEQPLYGLEARGLDGKTPPHTTVEAAAASYVQELRHHQPTGPYYLLGHSFGCMVAFEIAQQLHRDGETIGALILLDGGAPGGASESVDEVEILLSYERVILEEVGVAPTLTRDVLQPLTAEERIALLHQRYVQEGVLPAGSSTDATRGLITVAIADHHATYASATWSVVPIQFITAAEQSLEATHDLVNSWASYGSVTAYAGAGGHMSMLYPPHVQKVAAIIRAIVDGLPVSTTV
jgi:thioesterase domain-containing protein